MKAHESIAKIMAKHLIPMDAESSVLEVKLAMKRHQVEAIPIVKHGELIGLISKQSLRHAASGMSIGQFLDSNRRWYPISRLSPAQTIGEVRQFFDGRTDALPVVVGNELVGIVTDSAFQGWTD